MELMRQTMYTHWHLTQHPNNMRDRDTHSANGAAKSRLNNDAFTGMYACHILQQTAHKHVRTHVSAHTHTSHWHQYVLEYDTHPRSSHRVSIQSIARSHWHAHLMLTMVRRVLTKRGGGGGPLLRAADSDDTHRHTAYIGLAGVSVERAKPSKSKP
jgi:hypothetical protein